MKKELMDKNCYVIISSWRDLVWLTPVLNESNNIFVDYQDTYNSEEYIVPKLDPEDVILFVRCDLLTDEEKERLLTDKDAYDLVIANYGTDKTATEIIDHIERDTCNTYICTNEYMTFIGDIGLYKCY